MEQALNAQNHTLLKEKLEKAYTLWKNMPRIGEPTAEPKSVPLDLRSYGIYARYADVTFSTIESRGIPTNINEPYKKIKRYVEHLTENVHDGIGLILSGPVGNMKTTLAVAILRKYIELYHKGFMVSMSSFLTMIDNNYHFHKVDARIEKIKNTHLLIIDDLGAEYDHSWVQTQVDAIITERYNNKLATIITTNLSRDNIKSRYQQRIYDRLQSTNYLVSFSAKSQRSPLKWES